MIFIVPIINYFKRNLIEERNRKLFYWKQEIQELEEEAKKFYQ